MDECEGLEETQLGDGGETVAALQPCLGNEVEEEGGEGGPLGMSEEGEGYGG